MIPDHRGLSVFLQFSHIGLCKTLILAKDDLILFNCQQKLCYSREAVIGRCKQKSKHIAKKRAASHALLGSSEMHIPVLGLLVALFVCGFWENHALIQFLSFNTAKWEPQTLSVLQPPPEASCPCAVSQRMDPTPECSNQPLAFLQASCRLQECAHKNGAVLCSRPMRHDETGSKLLETPFLSLEMFQHLIRFALTFLALPSARQQAQGLWAVDSSPRAGGAEQPWEARLSPVTELPPGAGRRDTAGPATPPCSNQHRQYLLAFLCSGLALLQGFVLRTGRQLRAVRKVIKITWHLAASGTVEDSHFVFLFSPSMSEDSGLFFLLWST